MNKFARLAGLVAVLPFLLIVPKEAPMENETFTVLNDSDLALPAAIASVPTSSTITRVGVVTAIAESDNITVAISGSPTLVSASYLFPQYQPVLGDRVIVQKQDAQWLVLGTLSGPVDSNTLALNPGFELGAVGAIPQNWFRLVTDNTAGTPTFTMQQPFNPLSGLYVGQVELVNNGVLNFSIILMSSSTVPAREGEQWTGALYARMAALAGPDRVQMTTVIRYFDENNVLLTELLLNGGQEFAASGAGWQLIRPDSLYANENFAPAGTAYANLTIEVLFNIATANSITIVELDNAILRKVG